MAAGKNGPIGNAELLVASNRMSPYWSASLP